MMSEQVNFFELLKQKEDVKEETSQTSTQNEDEVKKEAESEKKETKKKELVNKVTIESYEYPFSLYTEGKTVDVSEYGFENNKKYTPEQICEIMLKHRHYEFAGEMTFKMFREDNMLVATAKQYKKG